MKELNLTGKATSNLNKYLPHLLIVGFVLFVYIQNLWFGLIYLDDQMVLLEYNKIESISKIPGAFLGGYLFDIYYRPLVMVSLIIDTVIAGQSSFMYHLTNIVLHLCVSLLLYKLLLKLNIKQNISLLLSLIFAVHPINTNAVSWIVGRNDLLPALFTLISFLSFINFVNRNNKVFISLSLIFYLFAMLSKEVGVIIPVVFVFYYLLIERKKINIKFFSIFFIYLITAAVYFFLRIYVSHIIIKNEINIQSFIQNIHIIFEYLAKIFYFPAIEPLPMKNYLAVIIGLTLVFLSLLAFFKIRNDSKNRNIFLFGILFFLILSLPSLLVRIITEDGEPLYYDCRMYLPLIGILISLGGIIQSLKFKYFTKRKILFLLIISFIYTISYSFIKNETYRNGKIFWSTITRLHPQRGDYWIGFGTYYFNQRDYDMAAKIGEKAIKLNPSIKEYYYKTATAYIKSGNHDSAIEIINKVLNIESNKPKAYLNLLKLYVEVGDSTATKNTAKSLIDLAIKTGLSKYVIQAANYCLQSRNIKMAANLIYATLDIEPNNAISWNEYGLLLYRIGDIESAKAYFYKASTLDPTNIKYLTNLKMCN